MLPATDWDGPDQHDRGWTVLGRLRTKQEELAALAQSAEAAARRGSAAPAAPYNPSWALALFFAPTSRSMQSLDEQGRYFNERSGPSWDLLFPGYYRSTDSTLEKVLGTAPIGRDFANNWYFDPFSFNQIRARVEMQSRHWKFSGESEIVLIGCSLPRDGAIVVNWETLVSGVISAEDGTANSMPNVVERLSRGLESWRDSGVGTRRGLVGAMTGESTVVRYREVFIELLIRLGAQVVSDLAGG